MNARVQIHRVMQYPAEKLLPTGGWLQVSRVFLSVTAGGRAFDDCTIEAHQAMDATGPRGPLVLGPLQPNGAPWDPDVCRAHVLAYLQGAQATMCLDGPPAKPPSAGRLLVREAAFRFHWLPGPGGR